MCKLLDTRGIWERKRADIAALSVFLTTCSKNHSLLPTFVQFLLFKQGDAGVHCGQHPTKTPQCSCDMKKGRFLHVPVFDNGKRLSQEPHTCSREVTRSYEKFFDVSRSFGVSRSSLKFREVSVFREVMTMPTIFYFHDGPYIFQ